MREFFRGWRRKAGCAALVMACLLTTLWLRSRTTIDIFTFTLAGRQHQIYIAQEDLGWLGASIGGRDYPPSGYRSFTSKSGVVQTARAELSFYEGLALVQPNWADHFDEWRLSFLWLTPPMTLLSVYLILWKPRQKGKPDA